MLTAVNAVKAKMGVTTTFFELEDLVSASGTLVMYESDPQNPDPINEKHLYDPSRDAGSSNI